MRFSTLDDTLDERRCPRGGSRSFYPLNGLYRVVCGGLDRISVLLVVHSAHVSRMGIGSVKYEARISPGREPKNPFWSRPPVGPPPFCSIYLRRAAPATPMPRPTRRAGSGSTGS